jgi:hypothetical protein
VRKAGAQEIWADQEEIGREEELIRGEDVVTVLRSLSVGWRRSRAVVLLGSLLVALGVLAPVARAGEAPPIPHWSIESRPAPTNLSPAHDGTNGKGLIVVQVDNLGDATQTGTTKIVDRLPADVKAAKGVGLRAKGGGQVGRRAPVECVTAATGNEVTCNDPEEVVSYEELVVKIPVEVEEEASGDTGASLDNDVVVNGGLAAEATLDRAVAFGASPSFGVESFELTPENEKLERDTQAGSHPFQMTTTFNLNESLAPEEPGSTKNVPAAPALQKELTFELPAGLLGNVNAVPECSDSDFGSQEEEEANGCAADTAVGVASVTVNVVTILHYSTLTVPVFNLVPAPGEPARFGFEVDHVPIVLTTSVRTGDDYGVNVSVHNASAAVQVLGSKVTFWGVPADPRHNASRGWSCLEYGSPGYKLEHPCELTAKPAQPQPFLTLPPSCNKTLEIFATGDAWNGGGEFADVKGEEVQEPGTLTGCGNLPAFEPTVQVHPESESASSPTGLTVQVEVPQETTLESTLEGAGRAEPDIEATTLVLPEGLQASPAAASGLATCSVGAAGFNGQEGDPGEALKEEPAFALQSFTPIAASCPPEAKIGTVDIKTPILKEEVVGSVYLASQDTNPFTSPLVLYIIAEEPTSKVLVKLAGEVKMNQVTGQLTSVFADTPETPFENLTLHLTGGQRASQSTPARCGEYSAKALFTTWSEPTETTERESNGSEFNITSGPGGSACPGATLPFGPGFQAGSTNGQAGAFSPFTLTIDKPDGQQSLTSITAQLPPGLAAEIAAVKPCENPTAIEALPTLTSSPPPCGPESEIGTTSSSSGLGGEPVTLPGKLYLTQGVDGAPFGLLAATKAEAGPFNLGWVYILSTITVNETTTAVTTRTIKPIPTILDGVPVQLKQINVTVERPGNAPFEFNPTNCTPMSVDGIFTGLEGASDSVPYPFVVSNCASLPFEPKLTASVAGQGSKAEGTTFIVKIESKGFGQANIHKVDLTIPSLLPSRLTTIQKACLEATFNANPGSCDEGSVIGEGVVHTPVFKNPLRGPAYLVSHGGAAFPDVEFVLKGEGVTVVLDGKTYIHEGVTYSKFETSPDAPFTSFESIFPAGPHSALTPSVPEKENFNLCKHTLTIPTEITGQNGAFISQTTKVAITGCKGVAAFKATKAQLLAKALKACKKDKKKSKRIACEKAARKKYGSKTKKSSKKKSKKKK